jgi:hypothetical protein
MKVSQYLRMAETDIVISPNSILNNLEDRLSGMNALDLEPSPGGRTGDPAKLTGVYADKKFRIDISIKNGEAFIKVQYNDSSVSKTFSPLEVARIPFWVSSVLV